MALEKQTITVPLGSMGMDAGKDPKVSPGLLRAENAAYNLDGSISKRTGCVRVATSFPADTFIGSRCGMDVEFAVPGGYIADDALTAITVASHPIPDVAVTGLSHTRSDVYHYCDIASNGTFLGLAYTSKTGANYYITVEGFAADTLLPSRSPVTFGPFTGPRTARVVKVGALLYYYYFDDSGVMWGGVFSSTGYPQATPDEYTGAVDALTTVYEWDACMIEGGGVSGLVPYVMVAYAGSTAGKACLLALPDGLNTSAVCLQVDNSSKPVSKPAIWKQSTSTVAIAYVCDDTTWKLYAAVYQYDAATQVLAPTLLDSLAKATYTPHAVTGVAQSTTRSRCYWDLVVASVPGIRYREFTTTAAVGSAAYFMRRARLAWKPALSARSYSTYPQHLLGVFTRSWNYALGAQDSIVMLLDNAVPCGKVLLGKARTGDSYGMLPSAAATVSSATQTRWLTVAEWIVELDNSVDAKNVYHLGQVVIDYDQLVTQAVAREAGRGRMIVPGSCPNEFDGADVVELGFLSYPEPFATSGSATAGSLTAKTYRYRLVYEWIDANGTKQQSAPSPEYNEITLTTETSVDLTCPTLTLTTKSSVQIAIYRTEGDLGVNYYRVGTVANSTAADSVAYNDGAADTAIVNYQPLYTDSGEVENVQPEAFRVHAVAGTRHFYVDRDAEEASVYYSKEFSSIGAVSHSDLQLIRVDPAGGAITALCGFLDKLVIFKSSSIFVSEGPGYDPTLGGSNYSAPYLVNPGVGCKDQRCLAVTPVGLVFLGSDGDIHLLNNSLQVTDFSAPVEYWTTTLTPVAFVAEPTKGLLHVFTTSHDLVYDWRHGKWALWSAHAALQASAVNGVAWWLDAAGALWRHDSSVYTDNAVRQAMTLETGWIALAQGAPARLYRATIIGQNLVSHTLRVKLGYDYDPHWVDSRLYDASALTTFAVSDYHGTGLSESYLGQAYCLRIDPTRPVCSAVRMSISDESGTGDTWSAAAVSLLIGVKGGGQRVQNARSK